MTSAIDDHAIPVTHLCHLPHRGTLPTVTPPATMCDHHRHQLADRIADIRRLWDALPQVGTRSRDGHGQAGYNSTPPMRLDVLAITDPHTQPGGEIPPAVAILTDAANWIADVRRLLPTHTADRALRVLEVHYPALTQHPNPAPVWRELTAVLAALRRIHGETTRPLGVCQEPADPDPQTDTPGECGGALQYVPQSDHPVQCQRCGDRWSRDAIHLAYSQMDLAAWMIETIEHRVSDA